MIVVVPSNREIRLDYLAPLIDAGARFVVVDDSPGSIGIDHPQFEVFNWADRERLLGAHDIGYPKRNGACRDLGFFIAWKNSDPDEIVVALDDDCKVYHSDFLDRVTATLSAQERPVATCQGHHLNILDLYREVPDHLFPRGFPYSRRGAHQGMRIEGTDSREVKFSLGLWKGVFDVNGIDKLRGPDYCHPQATLRESSVIVDRGKLISVCSMNMQFRSELIPAVYQLPMHVEVMPNWVVDRYGDIWGGFILKTLMDLRGDAMALGEPMINHLKDGDYSRNIWQEHICHLLNDEFLDMLGGIGETLIPDAYLEMMKQLNEGFKEQIERASPLMRPYLRHLCQALDAWNASLS